MDFSKMSSKQLQLELKRKGSKRGFKDISEWQLPPEAEGEEQEESPEEAQEPPMQRPRLQQAASEETEESVPPPTISSVASKAESNSNSSSSEPSPSHQETQQTEAAGSLSSRPNGAVAMPEEVMERATQSVMRNERLDGTTPRGICTYSKQAGQHQVQSIRQSDVVHRHR